VGSLLYLNAHSTMVGAQIGMTGQAQLTGDYPTQAQLTITGFDVGKPIELFSPDTIRATSAIDGTVTISGPLKTPVKMSGAAVFNNVHLNAEGIDLKAAEPLRVSLSDGVATLEQLHITGQDTDLHASGTAQVFGVTDPRGGRLSLRTTGSISTAIAHTFDPDILASGKVEFAVAARGHVKQPALTGEVQFEHVNAALDGVPNGLTDMNGTLAFNEDRLQVQNLSATTGGGKVAIGGFLTYRNGLYADQHDGGRRSCASLRSQRDREHQPQAARWSAEYAAQR
jgi:translocation and assembly module TamB